MAHNGPFLKAKAVAPCRPLADNGAPMTLEKETTMKASTFAATLLALAGLVGGAWAQQATFKRTVLQQSDISVPGREAVTSMVEFQPGGSPGRHTHPGEEIGYIVEGTFLLEQDGKPPANIKTGDAFIIPAGTVHNATYTGKGTGRVLATYVVEKGKPLATPAPAK